MPAGAVEERPASARDGQQTDLYRLFAVLLAPPSRACFDFLSQAAAASAFGDLWKALGCEGDFPGFEWFSSYEQYESAYIALFDVGLPEPPVPLFESAHDKSRPAQEIALENTYFHEVLGLRSDPARAVPDYLVTQLEFLAALRYTRENAADEATAAALGRAEAEFLERHMLNWVPAAQSKLHRTGAPGFPLLMTLLRQFLDQRYNDLRR